MHYPIRLLILVLVISLVQDVAAHAEQAPATEETEAVAAATDQEVLSPDLTDEQRATILAIADAQTSLPLFWEQHENRVETGASLFAVKVGFLTTNGATEQIWVTNLSREEDRFFGILGNDPKNIAGASQAGEPVTFQTGDITDWGYADGSRLRGHFTTRALVPFMPSLEAEHVTSLLHENPLP